MHYQASISMLNYFQSMPYTRRIASKCAKAYCICYNAISSGTYEVELDNTCISDVYICVENYFSHIKNKPTQRELDVVVYFVYKDLFPDANISLADIQEFS